MVVQVETEGLKMTQQKKFSISVLFRDTKETFLVRDVSIQMKIDTLKMQLEVIAGIPKRLQRLMYLDEGDMEDTSTLQHHDIVSGAQITMTVWRAWKHLIQACVKGEIEQVMELGVTADSSYRDPNSSFMTPNKRKEWFLERQWVSIFVAAHRGHVDIVKRLISAGADFENATKCGRTVLHIAAAAGRDSCIDLLLSYGAGKLIKMEDKFGQTPLQMAASYGHKSSERRLFLFQWQVRATKMKTGRVTTDKDLMAHQMYDSSLKTHMSGCHCQMYRTSILPPQEYEATTLEAKPSKHYYKISKESKAPHPSARSAHNVIAGKIANRIPQDQQKS